MWLDVPNVPHPRDGHVPWLDVPYVTIPKDGDVPWLNVPDVPNLGDVGTRCPKPLGWDRSWLDVLKVPKSLKSPKGL